jgi:hypothetical protein
VTWVRIDDGAPIHPKLLDAGPEAAWLWIAGLAHCNRAVTDGSIRKVHLLSLYPHEKWSAARVRALAARLVVAGLWVDQGDRYVVHDYAEYQEEALKGSVLGRREAAKLRKRAQREREKSSIPPPSHAVTPRDGKRDSARDASRDSARDIERDGDGGHPSSMSQPTVPSRPVPTEEKRSSAHAEVLAVFDHWKRAVGRSATSKLDGKRRARIEWALREYGLEQAMRAIDGCARSDFHMGRDPKSPAKHNDITLIFRDASKLEGFLDRAVEQTATRVSLPGTDADAAARRRAEIAAANARLRSIAG